MKAGVMPVYWDYTGDRRRPQVAGMNTGLNRRLRRWYCLSQNVLATVATIDMYGGEEGIHPCV